VIVVCPDLVELVRRLAPTAPLQLIENLPVTWELPPPSDSAVSALRSGLGLDNCRVVLYTGTFGRNQGLEMAIEAIEIVRRSRPEVRLVLVGGSGRDLERVQAFAGSDERGECVVFAGAQRSTMMPTFMALADILLSPRTAGTNTPLKIYSYLAAGKPIVATDLRTHTQVLSNDTAVLVPARSETLAAGILRVLGDPGEADRLAQAARRLAAERYGVEGYRRQLSDILARTCAAAGRRA
jgi:glycosyltransferase involved in cell wall biosynthesis